MKRRIVGAALAAGMAVWAYGAHAADAPETGPVWDVLKKHCSTPNAEALSIASQKRYWDSAESRFVDHTKAMEEPSKNRADRWFFDRISAEVGYGSKNTFELTETPIKYTRNDDGFGSIKYVLPFSAFREKRREAHRIDLVVAKRDFDASARRAAFYSAFVQFRTDVATPDKTNAAKQALAIGASSPAFAQECLNPNLFY